MTDPASSKANGKERLRGKPIVPGEVRNPEGRNQWTYRRDFEQTIAKLLDGELSAEEAENTPEWVRDIVEPGMTRGAALAAIAVTGALRGEGKHFEELLKRVWPATEKRELAGAGGEPLVPKAVPIIDLSIYTDQEREDLQRLCHLQLMAKPSTEEAP
jgi:hypothetical protein